MVDHVPLHILKFFFVFIKSSQPSNILKSQCNTLLAGRLLLFIKCQKSFLQVSVDFGFKLVFFGVFNFDCVDNVILLFVFKTDDRNINFFS